MNDDLRMLVLVTGEEGVGKSTVMGELLASTPGAAKLDAEDVGQVNPFEFGAEFLDLLWRNVVAVLGNFWSAGYNPIFTGSLLDGDTFESFARFRALVPEDVHIHIIHLRASKTVRDQRRIDRSKPSSAEWRDRVDASYPRGDTSLKDHAGSYAYTAIDNSGLTLEQTVAKVREALDDVA